MNETELLTTIYIATACCFLSGSIIVAKRILYAQLLKIHVPWAIKGFSILGFFGIMVGMIRPFYPFNDMVEVHLVIFFLSLTYLITSFLLKEKDEMKADKEMRKQLLSIWRLSRKNGENIGQLADRLKQLPPETLSKPVPPPPPGGSPPPPQ